jgi:SAM-dependent methyltransferase
MKYDPVKDIFAKTVRNRPFLRIIFYKILGIMFLREWHVRRELRKRLTDGRKEIDVYDAGSGFGQYSYYITTHFPAASIFAVDVKEDQIEDCTRFFQSRGLNRCSFSREDLTKIQHDNRFDFILSVDVMEHIADDVAVFKNFYCALRSNGVLFINTPSNLGGSDAHSPEDAGFIEEHARNGYGAEEIRTKLESAGFTVETITYTYGTWGNLSWRFGIKYPMKMLNVSKLFFVVLPFYYVVVFPFVLVMMWLDYVATNTSGTGLNVVARKK